MLTSRNLRGPLFTTFLFGGLDTQIEHHLFPTMPRANLRRARTLVRAFCDERVIAYAEESPWRAYRNVFHHLLVTGPADRAADRVAHLGADIGSDGGDGREQRLASASVARSS